MKTQHEVIHSVIHSGELKVNRKFYNSFIKAIFAGVFISLGALGNLVISADTYATNPGAAKFMGAVVFPVGLMAIVLMGLELFTSNCMNILAVVDKKTSYLKFFRNLFIVYLGNFIGCFIFAYISYRTLALGDSSVKLLSSVAEHKIHTDAFSLFLKGIMCNVLVVGAALFAYYSENVIGKIFAIWFPIMLFILLGYSHSVANMFYLSTFSFYTGNFDILGILYNLFFVTLGNFVGGILLVLVLNVDKDLK